MGGCNAASGESQNTRGFLAFLGPSDKQNGSARANDCLAAEFCQLAQRKRPSLALSFVYSDVGWALGLRKSVRSKTDDQCPGALAVMGNTHTRTLALRRNAEQSWQLRFVSGEGGQRHVTAINASYLPKLKEHVDCFRIGA